MIQNMKLRNFKCFPELELEFSKFTILCGANASGKSTVIQALLLAAGTEEQNGGSLDINKILGMAVGNAGALVSQNPIELPDCNFEIELTCDSRQKDFKYTIDRLFPIRLQYCCEDSDSFLQLQYLNAERTGPRISYPAGYDEKILSNGSNAAYLIEQADLSGRKISELLMLGKESQRFSYQAEQWMNVILGDVNLSVKTDTGKAITDIKYGNALTDQAVWPTMTGFGISYILSIVVAGLWCSAERNTVLIIENPEAHLHPRAQSTMGKFLQLLSETGTQVIVETHSEHIIDGARIQAAYMKKTEELSVYFMEAAESQIIARQIHISESGELDDWPRGFFDQKKQDLRELLEIRRGHAGR
ncbi:MAG: DUF3696 domain-containing protein [Eubacteriales bacterium]|nr:DUF3696 domain-containing protein [Eubacteriales bacterium]